jgi:hypothetical protein
MNLRKFCSVHWKKAFLLASAFSITNLCLSQLTGTITVGSGGDYESLSNTGGLFSAVNNAGLAGDLNVTISSDILEYGTVDLNQWSIGSSYSILISPSGSRTLSGTVSGGMIKLNGADNVVMDGLNSGGNSLTISNLSIATTASTISFLGDATGNVVRNCAIYGSSKSSTTGTILFSTGVATGNDDNTVTNCDIGPAGTSLPAMAITSVGSAGFTNDNIIITENNIHDWYLNGSSNAINVVSNSSAWTISSNKFYQTSARTLSGAPAVNYMKVIYIATSTGGGYTITNNTIGSASSNGSGMLTILNTYENSNGRGTFTAMDISVAASPISNIQGNTITNINLTSASQGELSGDGIFNGIVVRSGGVSIGGSTPSLGNIIGSLTGEASTTSGIYCSSSSTFQFATATAIFLNSSTACSIQNNVIGAITGVTSASAGFRFDGIALSGSGNHQILSNTIGGSTSNSIMVTGSPYFCGVNGITTTSYTGAITIGASGAGNIIQNLTANSSYAYLYGIQQGGVITGTSSISYNSFDNFSLPTMASSGYGNIYVISHTGNAVNATLNITNNTFGSNSGNFAPASTANYFAIACGKLKNELISNNNFNNITLNNSGVAMLINNDYIASANGTKTVEDNYITGGLMRTGVGSDFYAYYDFANHNASATITISGNNFSNITVNSNGNAGIIRSTGTGTPTLKVFNNTFNNITQSGITNYINLNGLGGTDVAPCQVYGNQITGSSIASFGDCKAINIGTTCNYVDIYNNNIGNFTLNNSTSNLTFYGISTEGTITPGTSQIINVYDNTISNVSSPGVYTNIYGIFNFGNGGTVNVYRNQINSLATASGYSNEISGIYFGGQGNSNIHHNKIYGLTTPSNNGVIKGILIGSGLTVNVYNNLVGDLNAPNSSLASPNSSITGLYIGGWNSSSVVSAFYNTVFLDANSGGTNFGTAAVYANTTPLVDLRNNIFVNKSIANGTGKAVAYQRGNSTINTYALTANNNLFYSPTTIYFDGTNTFNSLGTYQSFVSSRDNNAISEDPHWLSMTGSNVNYLHIDNAFTTAIESGAINISGITDDFDQEIRQGNPGYVGTGTAPDIGADEINEIPLVDLDGDGYSSAVDCNDNDPLIYPSATEICDNVDNNCNGTIDEGVSIAYYVDNDGDGYGIGPDINFCSDPGTGYTAQDGDCDDSNAQIHPGATEVCDGLDNNCDGSADEGLQFTNFFVDNDNDGYGAGVANSYCVDPGAGYAAQDGDCDDNNVQIHPGAVEICDGLDNDCNGSTDEGLQFTDYYLDGDNDGYGTGASNSYCDDPGVGYAMQNGDCNDNNSAVNPNAVDIPNNGIDENCDGVDGYLSLNEVGSDFMTIKPNPVHDYTTFTYMGNMEDVILTLVSMNGEILRQIEIHLNETIIQKEQLTSGVYFAKISVKGEQKVVLKLIIL